MKKLIVIIVCTLIWLPTCVFGQGYEPKYTVIFDEDIGRELLEQCSRWAPENVSDFWKPSASDVSKLEERLSQVEKMKVRGNTYPMKIQDIANYGFQYVGVTIGKRKYIYVNAFFAHIEEFESFLKDWDKSPLIMCDGGDNYWGVLYDIRTRGFKDLSINGVG